MGEVSATPLEVVQAAVAMEASKAEATQPAPSAATETSVTAPTETIVADDARAASEIGTQQPEDSPLLDADPPENGGAAIAPADEAVIASESHDNSSPEPADENNGANDGDEPPKNDQESALESLDEQGGQGAVEVSEESVIDEQAAEITQSRETEDPNSPEATEKRHREVGWKTIEDADNEVADRIKGMTPEEQKAWFQAHKNEDALVYVRRLQYLPTGNYPPSNENDTQPEGYDLTKGNPLIVSYEGQRVSLTRLMSGDGDNFTCKGLVDVLDADGEPVGKKEIPVTVPRQAVVDAQIVAEQQAIRETLPVHRRDTFDIYASILKGKVTGKNPLETYGEQELRRLNEDAEKAKEPEDPSMRIFRLAQETHASYIPGHEEAALKHYRGKYREEFEGLEKKNIDAEERRLGKKLTPEQRLLVQMKTIGEFQTAKQMAYELTNLDLNTYETWFSNFREQTGRNPTPDEQFKYKQTLKYSGGNRSDLEVVLNKQTMQEMVKTMSTKNRLAILAFLAAMVGKEILKDFMPPTQ